MSKTHLEYMMFESGQHVQESVPQYYAQMQVNMYLTGLKKGLFASFDDRYYNESNHLHTVTVEYDEVFIERLKTKLTHAIEYRNQILNRIK